MLLRPLILCLALAPCGIRAEEPASVHEMISCVIQPQKTFSECVLNKGVIGLGACSLTGLWAVNKASQLLNYALPQEANIALAIPLAIITCIFGNALNECLDEGIDTPEERTT